MKNIQLIAPASYVPNLDITQLDYLAQQLKKLDFHLCYSDALFKKKYFLAGDDETRLKDLEDAFSNPHIDAILTLRGGEGSMRLLDKIDYKKIQKHPKILIGFSDITALQNALWKKIQMPSYTGFIGKFGFQKISAKTLQNLKYCLNNTIQKMAIKTIRPGKTKGILIGGNLTVFCALLGTQFFPDPKDKVLLLEEANESAYCLDRLFNQLHLSGVFHQISGLILGDMTAGLNTQEKRLAKQVIQEHLANLKCPVVSLKNYSHEYKSAILPIGAKVTIDSTKSTLLLDKIKNFS